nr:serine hydrolase domain-containing protein [uncultured Acetatifactor sp.]
MRDYRCSGSSPALAGRIQEKLEGIVREKKTTAACAAVCGPGGLLAAACAGTRGFEDSLARVDDLYNVGSVSKIYVTAAVMKLVQEGRVSLDEPVRRYLPHWKLADARCREITVRMLLNHSSGIPGTNLHDHLAPEEGEDLFTGRYRNTPAYWQTVKLRARPGCFSGYCNDGFDLAAEVVEAVTGEPYIRWLREQITGPAGLFSVGVGRRLAEGYVKVSCRGAEPEYYNCFGAGAIHTTVPECAMFGFLFVDSRGIVGQAWLDETRRPQGATFLQGAYDAVNYCLGWDSLYNRNRIPLGEGAVVKEGGTEQFTSYLLVSPACRLSLAISGTSDGDVPWLEVLEDIGGEALKLLGKERKEDGGAGDGAGERASACKRQGEGESLKAPETVGGEGESLKAPETVGGEGESLKAPEPVSGERESLKMPEPVSGEGERLKTPEPIGIAKSVLLESPGRYSGLAYGSVGVYRFSVHNDTLQTETLQKGGGWQREEELSGFRWDGSSFAKGEHDRITAEEYDGKVYYIRWGVAFCQRNSGYPSPGTIWPRLAGSCFTAEGGGEAFGRICLEAINEENVLIFTTDHEEYPVVPLVCDPRKADETCLISETSWDGIVFRLEQEGEQARLCMGTDKFMKTTKNNKNPQKQE